MVTSKELLEKVRKAREANRWDERRPLPPPPPDDDTAVSDEVMWQEHVAQNNPIREAAGMPLLGPEDKADFLRRRREWREKSLTRQQKQHLIDSQD